MSILDRYRSSLRSVWAFLIALAAQLAVVVLLTPWIAPTSAEFYEGAERALIISLFAHVIVRLVLPLVWRTETVLGNAERGVGSQHRSGGGPWGLAFQAFSASMLVALGVAMAIDNQFIGDTVGIFLCVTAQQLAFVTAAFQMRERSQAARGAGRTWPSLTVICLLALYFSLVVPSLFRQIATGTVVQNNPENLVFAIPVILVALAGIIRGRFSRV
jgi:hypothetical protein